MKNKKRYLLKNGLTLASKVTGVAHLEKEDLKEVLDVFDRLEKLEKFVKEINNIFDFGVVEYKGNYSLEYTRYSVTHSFDIDEELAKLVKEVLQNVKE